jgi:hypothetical protein
VEWIYWLALACFLSSLLLVAVMYGGAHSNPRDNDN